MVIRFYYTIAILVLAVIVPLNAQVLNSNVTASGKSLIFPIPLEVQLKDGKFIIDKLTFIAQAENENKDDTFLNNLLAHDLVDRFGSTIAIKKVISVSKRDKSILIGTLSNPLVEKYCEQEGITTSELKKLGNEGYILSVSTNKVVIAANTKKGALYGLESLRQIISDEKGTIHIPQLMVKDKPAFPFRGIKLYLPGSENIPFFKRFIKDFVALYKFNKIILEMNANMRLSKHPELNIATVEFTEYLNKSRLERPPGPNQEYQNSSHQDNADGEILEKTEVTDLVDYIRNFNIEVIPEVPSLTHSYYLLGGHKDLAENPKQKYPDTYNPLKPEIYKIYFDVLDEYIDAIRPSMIHVGHDEWRVEKGANPLTRGKDYGKLFADDLNKIHDYLMKKGIKIGIWGDHLLESVQGKDYRVWKTSTGYEYKIPGAMKPEQVLDLIPKDILVFNWFWNDINNDRQLSDFGFQQVYGNLIPEIGNFPDRKQIKGVLGGAPSSWAATTEFNIGKDQLYDFLGSANLLWSDQNLTQKELVLTVEPMVNGIRDNLSGMILPSNNSAVVNPLDISNQFNSSLKNGMVDLKGIELQSGIIRAENKIFDLSSKKEKAIVAKSSPDNSESASIVEINKDVSSIIFLHASAKVSTNAKSYWRIYDVENTAEPLGYYIVEYENGLVEIITLRYGVNILDWRWKQRISLDEENKENDNQNKYAYAASAVECSKDDSSPVTFFAYEWKNPHYGKKIKQITLHSIDLKKGNENAVILLGVSVTENRKVKEAAGIENH